MYGEIKYIIVKDVFGHLRHFKSEWKHHSNIARDNGYDMQDVLECGMFLEHKLFILECINNTHMVKKANNVIANNLYQEERIRVQTGQIGTMQNWLRSRELESEYYYSKKRVGLREGD